MRAILVILSLLAVASSARARVNVVTLPGRDSVLLTIYNSVDLTLVKETRTLTFRRGLNRLEFSWANTLIDPTSVEFRALTHADEVEVLDVSFPPRVTNTLEWRINSEFAGEVKVEIRYFTSGIAWSADYIVEAERAERNAALAGYVRVTNNSGEDYENAQLRLVVGVIRLVEEIAQLSPSNARRPMTEALKEQNEKRDRAYFAYREADMLFDKSAAAGGKLKQMIKENLSEYYLYTVDGRDTVPHGWAKRLPSFNTNGVPLTSYYKYEKERWGDRVVRYYRFKNDTASKLGSEPLPDGDVKAFRVVSDDSLYAFVGRTSVKYVPVDEQVELELGEDLEVIVKPKLMNWVKTDIRFEPNGNVKGWTTKETWEIEVQNSKDIDVVLDIRRNFAGDWTLRSGTQHENVDAAKIKFVLPLKPREKQRFTYELETRHGTNATR
jgi:hypothetical protein